ncbi:MAG TPA: flagellin, partial [Alphaproteobacteria bacterium]
MTNEVVLSAALRSNLLSLQRTQSSIDKVQNVLATGLKVASALDNPQNFFASQSLKNRSSDLTKLLDGIGQSIQTIKAADAGVTSLTKLVEQAQSIADSARDAVSNGAKEASITGSVDLSGITSNGATGGLTSVTGISNGAELAFQVKDKDGALVDVSAAGLVAIATGDSIDQLITKINDLVNSVTGDAVLHAELTSAGKLKITALDGGSFSLAFDADGGGAGNTGNTGLGGVASAGETTGETAADLSLASALGFGNTAQRTEAGASGGSQVYSTTVTALSSTKLTSGVFYEAGGSTNGIAEASDLLTNVVDTLGGSGARFAASAGETAGIVITVNGQKTSTKINIAGTTIQGLVDGINNDTAIGDLVEASYDAETGKFSIEAQDSTVNTIRIYLDGVTDSVAATEADFDFGTSDT